MRQGFGVLSVLPRCIYWLLPLGKFGLLTSNSAKEAHDWILKPKRTTAAFNYYARAEFLEEIRRTWTVSRLRPAMRVSGSGTDRSTT